MSGSKCIHISYAAQSNWFFPLSSDLHEKGMYGKWHELFWSRVWIWLHHIWFVIRIQTPSISWELETFVWNLLKYMIPLLYDLRPKNIQYLCFILYDRTKPTRLMKYVAMIVEKWSMKMETNVRFLCTFFLMLASDGCMIPHWIYVKY